MDSAEMKIAIACDHAGYTAKEMLKQYLEEKGYRIHDFGCYAAERCNYPDYAITVGEAVSRGEYNRGILICGTGLGMSIIANKVKGIRATVCHDLFTAKMSREHNNANILCMGEWMVAARQMKEIADIWLTTDFLGGSHSKRLDIISKYDESR